MKKIYASIFISVSFCTGIAAQPTLTSPGIVPIVGDMSDLAASNYVSEGTAGPNQTWNPGFTNYATWSLNGAAPSSTPYASSFPTSTVAFSSGPNWLYYNSTGSAIQSTGLVYSTGQVLSYSDPEDILHFPFNYNDSYTDSWSCTYVQSSNTYYRTGTVTVTADGWGTLTTPAGTFSNVMRVHFVELYQDSTNISSTPVITNYSDDEYKWYVNGNHYQVGGTYTFISPNGTTTSSYYLVNFTAGMKEDSSILSLSASPNPAQNNVKMVFGMKHAGPVAVHIFDITGKEVREPVFIEAATCENELNLSVADLPDGIYFASIVLNGEMISAQRIAVAH